MKIYTRCLTHFGTDRIEITVKIEHENGEVVDEHNRAESEQFALDALSALAEHYGTQTLEATEDGKTSSGQYFVGVNGVQIPLSDAFVESIRNEDPRIDEALGLINEAMETNASRDEMVAYMVDIATALGAKPV